MKSDPTWKLVGTLTTRIACRLMARREAELQMERASTAAPIEEKGLRDAARCPAPVCLDNAEGKSGRLIQGEGLNQAAGAASERTRGGSAEKDAGRREVMRGDLPALRLPVRVAMQDKRGQFVVVSDHSPVDRHGAASRLLWARRLAAIDIPLAIVR